MSETIAVESMAMKMLAAPSFSLPNEKDSTFPHRTAYIEMQYFDFTAMQMPGNLLNMLNQITSVFLRRK